MKEFFKVFSGKEWIAVLFSLIVVFLNMPKAYACDTPVVVDTWVQDAGKSTGKIVVRQYCPLAGIAAVQVVDAKVTEVVTQEATLKVVLPVPAPVQEPSVRSVKFSEDVDVVLIYDGAVIREVRIYPKSKGK